MPVYSYDHIHLRTRDPMATAQYYQRMFDAKIIESIQSDGRPRIDLDINGLTVFLAHVPAEADIPRLLWSRTLAWITSGCVSTISTLHTPNSPSVAPSSPCPRGPSDLVSGLPLSRRQRTCASSCSSAPETVSPWSPPPRRGGPG